MRRLAWQHTHVQAQVGCPADEPQHTDRRRTHDKEEVKQWEAMPMRGDKRRVARTTANQPAIANHRNLRATNGKKKLPNGNFG